MAQTWLTCFSLGRDVRDSNEDGRANNFSGSSSNCRALDPRLLPAAQLSGSGRVSGSERPVAVISSFAAWQCSRPARHRFHSVVLSAQSMPNAKPVFISYKRNRTMSLIDEFNAATQSLDRILDKMEEADPTDKERLEAYVKSMQVKVQRILKAILRVH